MNEMTLVHVHLRDRRARGQTFTCDVTGILCEVSPSSDKKPRHAGELQRWAWSRRLSEWALVRFTKSGGSRKRTARHKGRASRFCFVLISFSF